MKKVINYLLKAVLAILFGVLAGLIISLFIRIMGIGMEFLWEKLPSKINIPIYPLIVCGIGALIIGLFRKFFGDYPEELMVILGKIKKDKNYEFKKLPIIFVGALMPVVCGYSVVNYCNHYKIPFVDGISSLYFSSIETAIFRALARALNAPSIM